MTENEIAAKVMDASFLIHRELGPGLMKASMNLYWPGN